MSGLSITVPDELLEEIARRVRADLVSDRQAPEPWIGVALAAEHLCCKPQRIYDLVSQKDSGLPFRKEGSRLLFRRSELDRWLDRGATR